MTDKINHLRDYHAPVWDEPLVMQLGYPGRRGQVFQQPAGNASTLIPKGLARTQAPALRSCRSLRCSATTCICARRRWAC